MKSSINDLKELSDDELLDYVNGLEAEYEELGLQYAIALDDLADVKDYASASTQCVEFFMYGLALMDSKDFKAAGDNINIAYKIYKEAIHDRFPECMVVDRALDSNSGNTFVFNNSDTIN